MSESTAPLPKDYRPKASREASYFHDEKDVQNGVIVECNWAKSDPIKQTVVNFARHTSAYAMESCFKHREHAETRSQFYKDERPYEVFENVNYEAGHNGMVTSRISRNQKKWECQNMGHDIFAVKAKCVFSFEDGGRCDTDIIENVEFDRGIFNTQVLCQNVTFNCWLQFKFTKSADVDTKNPTEQPVTYKLHSVEEVNPDAFDFARGASWARKKTFAYDDDYDPFSVLKIVNPDHVKPHLSLKAYMLSGSNIYIPTKPRWRISLAFNKAQSLLENNVIPLQPHDPLLVDIRYNPVVERYIVFNASKRLGSANLQGQYVERDDAYNPENKARVHKVSVRPVSMCHGYFFFGDNNNKHLVYDVNGLLAFYYTRDQSVLIPIEFIYVDPGERDITQLVVYSAERAQKHDLAQETYIGLCIADGEIYCSNLHFLVLKAPDAQIVGEWYEFKIIALDHDRRIAEVDTWIMVDRRRVLSKVVNNQYEFLFPLDFPIKPICVARGVGPVGVSDAQAETIGQKNAAAVVFPQLHPNPYIRPNVRPMLKTAYKTYDDGIKFGSFK